MKLKIKYSQDFNVRTLSYRYLFKQGKRKGTKKARLDLQKSKPLILFSDNNISILL